MKKSLLTVSSSKSGKAGKSSSGLVKLLRWHFGHRNFRDKQLDAIQAVLSGRDCFCLMPTGGGKSMCYQIPALAKPSGIVLVVSPLIALMENQVMALKEKGIAAEFLSSTQTSSVRNKIHEDLNSGKPATRLLYVTPELIATAGFMSKLKKIHSRGLLNLIAIDEAHCISTWGHDSRPSYRQLSSLRSHLSDVPILALTATAVPKVQNDVIGSLHLYDPLVLKSSFNRPNIYYEVRYKELLNDVYADLSSVISSCGDVCAIVYCLDRTACDALSAHLSKTGISSAAYHAGLTNKLRTSVLDDWISSKIQGIDRKDVRLVIHFNIPKSMEAFCQESGRAGRDQLPCRSLLYYGVDDRKRMEFILRNAQSRKLQSPSSQDGLSKKDDRLLKKSLSNFNQMVEYCESPGCRRRKILESFGEQVSTSLCERSCDACKHPNLVSRYLQELTATCATRQRSGLKHEITSLQHQERRLRDLERHLRDEERHSLSKKNRRKAGERRSLEEDGIMEEIASVAGAESLRPGTQLENMPDVVLLHILSFLPTADVVRTSALAKRWQNFWKLASHVDIEEGEDTEWRVLKHSEEQICERVSFMNFVENVLLKRESSKIDYFALSLCVLRDAPRINTWILDALTHKVQKLRLKLKRILDKDFELSSGLFTCQFLTQLKIDMTADLRLPPTTWLPGLEELELQDLTLPGDISTTGLFSGCPNLKKLSLTYCDWSEVRSSICISAPRLEELIISVNEMYHCNSPWAPQVIIIAANLKLFSFTGDLNNDYFISSSALIEGSINFQPSEDPRGDRELAYRLHRLLWRLAGVKSLSISIDALEVLDCAKDLLAHLPTFGRLDSLFLTGRTQFPSESLLTILQKSTRLSLLDFSSGFRLENFKGMPLFNPVPSCFSTHLKTIRTTYYDTDVELYILSELLRAGSVLEKVYISSRKLKDGADSILRLYRQSRNCMIYLLPLKQRLKSSNFI